MRRVELWNWIRLTMILKRKPLLEYVARFLGYNDLCYVFAPSYILSACN